MERFIIDVLLACRTVKAACELLNISWEQAWNVMDRAVKRGMLRKEAISSRLFGVDEKASRKDHRYLMIVNYIDKGTVEFIAENREKSRKMNEGVDKVRKEEHRALMALGSNTLSKTK